MRLFLSVFCVYTVGFVACSGGYKPDPRTVATLTAESAYAILSMAYSLEAVTITREQCQAYPCTTEVECNSVADRCPALIEQKERWMRVFDAYDMLAEAVEAGNTEQAKRLYCELAAITKAPLPKSGC